MNSGGENGDFPPIARASLFIPKGKRISALDFRIARHGEDQTLHVANVEGNRRGQHRPLRTGNEEAIIIASRKIRDVWSN